jgi:hypothetical protein
MKVTAISENVPEGRAVSAGWDETVKVCMCMYPSNEQCMENSQGMYVYVSLKSTMHGKQSRYVCVYVSLK